MSQLSVDSGQLPVGYKQTEHWIIPEDWDVKPLGELVHSVEYGSSAKSSSSGAMPVLRMGNLQDGQVDWDDLVYTDDEAEIAKYQLNHNDILFNRTNTVDLVGKTSIYKGEFPAIFAGYLIRINRKEKLLDAEYLNYILNTNQAKKYSKLILSVAVSQANINGQKLKTYPIPVPPTLEEQQLIAQALSGVDTLITSLEKLIAKKRAIKTATMQQLLTGKKRLPEFEGDWLNLKFEDVVTGFSSGATPSRGKPDYFKGNIPWITSGELNYNIITGTIEKLTDSAVKNTNLTLHPPGTFLMAITGLEAEGTRGSCAITGIAATTNQSCMALHPKKGFSNRYLYHYYVCHGDNLALEYCQGTKQQSFTGSIVKVLPIFVPPSFEEQEAIANVLAEMDESINALQTQLTKTQQLKQGMMQELLTGRTRLI